MGVGRTSGCAMHTAAGCLSPGSRPQNPMTHKKCTRLIRLVMSVWVVYSGMQTFAIFHTKVKNKNQLQYSEVLLILLPVFLVNPSPAMPSSACLFCCCCSLRIKDGLVIDKTRRLRLSSDSRRMKILIIARVRLQSHFLGD